MSYEALFTVVGRARFFCFLFRMILSQEVLIQYAGWLGPKTDAAWGMTGKCRDNSHRKGNLKIANAKTGMGGKYADTPILLLKIRSFHRVQSSWFDWCVSQRWNWANTRPIGKFRHDLA